MSRRSLFCLAFFLLAGCLTDSGHHLRLIICGDSIASRYAAESGIVGWGEVIADSLSDQVDVYNHSVPGISAQSFVSGSLSRALAAHADIALVHFGHNYNDSLNEAVALDSMIRSFERNGTRVVLIAPMQTRSNSQHWPVLDGAVHAAARRHAVPLVPLDSLTSAAWTALGTAGTAQLYHDEIHLNADGACRVAGMIASSLISFEPELKP